VAPRLHRGEILSLIKNERDIAIQGRAQGAVLGQQLIDHLTAAVCKTAFACPRQRHPDERDGPTVSSRQIRGDGIDCVPESFDDVSWIGGDPVHGSERTHPSLVNVG